MASSGGPTIVGGGINLGSPAVIGNFLKLTSITPPAANVSLRLIEQATSIVLLGDGLRSTSIGDGADANGIDQIAIGTNVTTQGAAARCVLIGDNIAPGAASNLIAIGRVSFGGGVSGGSDATLIGQNQNFTQNPSTSVYIGNNIAGNGNQCVVVGVNAAAPGNNAIVIGSSASASTNGMAIGAGASTGGGGSTNSLCIGNSAIGPSGVNGVLLLGNRGTANPADTIAGDMVIGHQDNGNQIFSLRLWLGGPFHRTATAVPGFTIAGRKANGTDLTAGDLTIVAPLASGNATGGGIAFQTAPIGASGTTVQTPATRFRIEPTGNITLTATAGSYGSGVGVTFIGNAGTVPSTDPVGGGILYVEAGALTFRGSAGTVTVVAPA